MDDRFVSCDRSTPLLFPPDLRDWVTEDDFVHFVIEAVNEVPVESFRTKKSASGSKQYEPRMMLALLIYCYSSGTFSSRRIERATYRDVGVRYLTANEHPDHDTICKFRRENFSAVAEAFLQTLCLARAAGLLKVGTVSVDGTLIKANASKYKTVTYGRACEIEKRLKEEVNELLEKAEGADRSDEADGQRLPAELHGRQKLKAKLAAAREELERRARRDAQAKMPEYEAKVEAREKRNGSSKGGQPKPPKEVPEDDAKINLTDADAKLMRKNKRSDWQQAYNCQAAVDADGSQLVLSCHVSTCASDANELERAVEAIPEELGAVKAVLADTGYANAEAIRRLEGKGLDLYVAVSRDESHTQRKHDFRPACPKSVKTVANPTLVQMREKLRTEEGRAKYKRRTCTVEPVFGIVKRVLGFRQFSLRGSDKVAGEWDLVCLSYNLKRIFNLKLA